MLILTCSVVGSFTAAILVSSLAEYWIHRLMHVSPKIGARHRDHHRRNEGQGVIWEMRDYLVGSLVLLWPPFLLSLPIGLGWVTGAVFYAAFSAYAHQLQHENPIKCSWMPLPVHYVHHKYGMWEHNFGLAVDWWDRAFGTYKKVDWLSEEEQKLASLSRWQLRWW